MRADPPSHPPRQVELQLIGFEGRSCQLDWDSGQLWFRESPTGAGDLHRIPWQAYCEPAAAAWQRLRVCLETVDFWRWPSVDGDEDGRWRLSLRWDGRSRNLAGALAPHPALTEVVEAILSLRSQPSTDYPQAFRLRCDWPGGEEHFGWDGRHLAFAAFQPRPRIHEGQQVPPGAWKEIASILAAGLPVPQRSRMEEECFLVEPLFEGTPLPAREIPAPLRHELRQRLKGLLPAHCRLDGVPGTGLAARI